MPGTTRYRKFSLKKFALKSCAGAHIEQGLVTEERFTSLPSLLRVSGINLSLVSIV